MATTLLPRRGLREEKRRRWELTCCEKDCVGDERRRPENWAQFVETIDAIVKSQSESQIIISAALALALPLAQPLCMCVWLVERVGRRVTLWCSVGENFYPFFFPYGVIEVREDEPFWDSRDSLERGIYARRRVVECWSVTTTIPNWTENLGSVRFNFQI